MGREVEEVGEDHRHVEHPPGARHQAGGPRSRVEGGCSEPTGYQVPEGVLERQLCDWCCVLQWRQSCNKEEDQRGDEVGGEDDEPHLPAEGVEPGGQGDGVLCRVLAKKNINSSLWHLFLLTFYAEK